MKLVNKYPSLHIESIKELIKRQGFYKNPDFNLTDLSRALARDRKIVTKELKNQGAGFYLILNEVRVDAMSNKLAKYEYKYMSVSDLAILCGFKSKTTLFKYFLHFKGESPGEMTTERLL